MNGSSTGITTGDAMVEGARWGGREKSGKRRSRRRSATMRVLFTAKANLEPNGRAPFSSYISSTIEIKPIVYTCVNNTDILAPPLDCISRDSRRGGAQGITKFCTFDHMIGLTLSAHHFDILASHVSSHVGRVVSHQHKPVLHMLFLFCFVLLPRIVIEFAA